ncbi:MAG: hypothetical protein KVP17_002255 [Porospora cf. gigantea B]|uniref:uncharacterized protein n=1 Tax=Porospora cf. gigantea B TaxID=2853592 RepID=UPI0035718755|nr:MAG: hypothetical protein KVP17_002255 [Porospora cf. gigantea B]
MPLYSCINLLVVVAVLVRPERFVEGACQLKRGHLVMATLLLGFMGPVILIFDADFRLAHVLPVVCPSVCLVGWAMLSWRLRYLQKKDVEHTSGEASSLIQPMEPYLRDMSCESPSTVTSFLDSDETPKQDHMSISVGSLTTDVEEVPLMA